MREVKPATSILSLLSFLLLWGCAAQQIKTEDTVLAETEKLFQAYLMKGQEYENQK